MGLLAAALMHGVLLLVPLWQRGRQSTQAAAPALIDLRLLTTPSERQEPARRAAVARARSGAAGAAAAHQLVAAKATDHRGAGREYRLPY